VMGIVRIDYKLLQIVGLLYVRPDLTILRLKNGKKSQN